jgi:hypothetical protein
MMMMTMVVMMMNDDHDDDDDDDDDDDHDYDAYDEHANAVEDARVMAVTRGNFGRTVGG